MREDLAELWRFRGLLLQLVKRDIKVRYKNSRLGFLWSIAPPLMQVACITFAFKHATNFAAKIENYSAYVLVAIIPWTYFQTAILDSSQSLLAMYGVIKKVYMPREIIPLATAISNLIHFLLSWAVFFLYLVFYLHAPILPTVIWFPYLVVVMFLFTTGCCFVISCLNVFYEDVKYMVSIFMGLFLFVLPIMYLVEQVVYSESGGGRIGSNPWLSILYLDNPLTALINGFRKTMLQPPPAAAFNGPALPLDVPVLLLTGLIAVVVFLGGYAYFNKRKWQFVERP